VAVTINGADDVTLVEKRVGWVEGRETHRDGDAPGRCVDDGLPA
jgi:hypothetical protein